MDMDLPSDDDMGIRVRAALPRPSSDSDPIQAAAHLQANAGNS